MREILFRAKRVDNGEWAEGILYNDKSYAAIHDERTCDCWDDFEEVDPSTVGQYTGLTDKNGKRIFEGDICEDARGFRFAVAWDEDNARFLGRGYGKQQEYARYVGQEPAVMVIGNIHDNPELLEVFHD